MSEPAVALSALEGPSAASGAGDRIEEMVQHRAEERPDATAVRWGGSRLSYRELADGATQIASSLERIGVGPSDVVAVQLPRCTDIITVILGVLKARAIYMLLPLDWPESRRRDALDRSGAKVCVSREEDAFACGRPMVVVDDLLRGDVQLAEETANSAHARSDLDDGCCVFFTSGSTGEPKCAVAPHRGVIRVACDPLVGFGPSTVMLQSSSMAWDLFALEVWAPLLRGGTTVLRESEYFSYDDLRRSAKDGVNTVVITPTLFNGAVADDVACFQGITTVLMGGERASARHVREFLTANPTSTVYNLYGPVEATIWVTLHRMASAADVPDDVPIGTPVPWTNIYLLDEERRVVPRGRTGEIAVAGAGLALRYLGDEKETARRFVRLPVGPDGEDVRLYLTGDFGSVDEHDRLLFAGRKDRQVKILGIRVEPSEVERVLEKLPGISGVVAIPIPIGVDRPEGLAVVYAAMPDGPRPEDVRRAVAAELPHGFVPQRVQQVDALPLNANGKADLGAVARSLSDGEEDGVTRGTPVRTPLVTLLVELEALTGVAPAMDSDVVRLGLTSITALKLSSRIRAVHGIELPMNVIFRRRTPEAIAAWMAAE